MSPAKPAQKPTKKTSAPAKKAAGLSKGERDAVKARVQELKAEAKANKDRAAGEKAALASIAKMPNPYRDMAKRLHALIKATAPSLMPKTWYGLPAYALGGKAVCYMRMNPKSPYNDRYLNFGFNETANLDDGALWPTSFAVTKLTPAEEKKIAALVKKAVR
jgi:uncharacterized protein YdhG (YjbR/CyaY superfamily)